MLDQHKVRVPSLELIEANVEDDGDVAGDGEDYDEDDDGALQGLGQEVQPPLTR